MKIFYISEKVRKCIRALEAAETDTQKFAALFLVPKLVRGTECDKNARMCIMKVCKLQFRNYFRKWTFRDMMLMENYLTEFFFI